MTLGHADAPHAFLRLTKCAIPGLDCTRIYLDGAIVLDPSPALRVESIKVLLSCLEEHSLKLSPRKSRVGATTVDFLGHRISSRYLRPDAETFEALPKISMPAGVSELRLLIEVCRTVASSF